MIKLFARLLEAELWERFHNQTNEMIITKAGRCLFPLLRIEFIPSSEEPPSRITYLPVEIEPTIRYDVEVEMVSRDTHKWKYRHGQWIALLTSHNLFQTLSHRPASSILRHSSSSTTSSTLVIHYARQLSGAEIIREGLFLERLKISNRPDGSLSLHLQSFHRYIPLVHLRAVSLPTTPHPFSSLPSLYTSQTLCFPETEFIAVTHYQNEVITLLKKSYNPHAKGFVIVEPNMEVMFEEKDDIDREPESANSESPSHFTSVPSIGKRARRRVRRRIRPIQDTNTKSSQQQQQQQLLPSSLTAMPSDDEELQGGLDLQYLASGQQI